MTSLDIMFILVIAVTVWNKNVITWMTVLPSKVCPVANFQTTIIAWVPSGHNWLISTMLSPVECTLMTFDHPPFVSGDFQQQFFAHNPCLAVSWSSSNLFSPFLETYSTGVHAWIPGVHLCVHTWTTFLVYFLRIVKVSLCYWCVLQFEV